MEILDISTSRGNGVAMVRARLQPRAAAEPLELWFRFEGLDKPLDGVNEAVAAALVVRCMAEDEPLAMPGCVSPTFLANVTKAQRVLTGWYDDLHPVRIRCSTHDHSAYRRPRGVIC